MGVLSLSLHALPTRENILAHTALIQEILTDSCQILTDRPVLARIVHDSDMIPTDTCKYLLIPDVGIHIPTDLLVGILSLFRVGIMTVSEQYL